MSIYKDELLAAERQGCAAHDAMEAWVSREAGAPETPAAVLEGHARELRASRERLRNLLSEHGNRDDIAGALTRNQTYHTSLGLSIKDKPEFDSGPEAES